MSYTISKTLPITKQIKLVKKNKIANIALNKNIKIFIVSKISSKPSLTLAFSIKILYIALLIIKIINNFNKYASFFNIFLKY